MQPGAWLIGYTGAGGGSGHLDPRTVGDEPRARGAAGEEGARARSFTAGAGASYAPAFPSVPGLGTC